MRLLFVVRFFLKVSELFEKTRVSTFLCPLCCVLFHLIPAQVKVEQLLMTDVSSCLLQKIEARVAADEDLKLADLLKYYLRESQAAKVTPLPVT